ncbi:MAG TPA: hypothetical protein VH041_03620 [Caldimonas sp.]|nr:hypothetical protein [Caldimonas sp.]HEX4233369.1 hypothetical protein [Caldimonas sp.]
MFAIKAEVVDLQAATFAFGEQKTMDGGRHLAKSDLILIFTSENETGPGLVASGVASSAGAIPKKPGIVPQTPRVSITVERLARAKRRLGRNDLKQYCNRDDGRPESELDFKLYRQATDKIAGISDAAADPRGFF